jgi:hypothetical protein
MHNTPVLRNATAPESPAWGSVRSDVVPRGVDMRAQENFEIWKRSIPSGSMLRSGLRVWKLERDYRGNLRGR